MRLHVAALLTALGLHCTLGAPLDEAKVDVSEDEAVSSEGKHSQLSKRGLFGGPPSKGEICPQAQGLFHQVGSGFQYQIGCAVEVSGGTLLAVYKDQSNVLACAQQCDNWNQGPSGRNRECRTASYYHTPPNGVHSCYLRTIDMSSVASAPFENVESAFKGLWN